MTSILRPAVTAQLGDQRWSEQVSATELRLGLAPMVDVATVRLPAAAPLAATIGAPVRVELDGGDGAEAVFSGVVRTIHRELTSVTVTATGGGALLAEFRPATTYEQATASTIIQELCGDAGVDTGDVDTGVSLAYYAADPGRTALEHVARVAGWGGALVRFDADDLLRATVVNAAQAELALRYGRDLLAVGQARSTTPVTGFVVAGEAGASGTSDPAALRATGDFFGGNRPDGPSATSRWRFEPALRTAEAAGTAGAAAGRAYQASRRSTVLTTVLAPRVRPAAVLEVQDLPAGIDGGPWWVEQVTHRVSATGARSRIRLRPGGDTFDPTAALTSLF